MDKVKRYVIRMYNGDYMQQVLDDTRFMVHINSTENPVDATLFKRRDVVDRVLKETKDNIENVIPHDLTDKNNPPVEVLEIDITYQLTRTVIIHE